MGAFFKRHGMTVLAALYFVAFFALLVFSNGNDWDQQLSTMAVDRFSWLHDHRLPYWSYQFCGGSSRIGDPQSYALSPVFSIPLVFGAFWGAKILVLLASVLGFWYLRRTLLLLGPKPDSRFSFIASALSLVFIFQNYFLWNFYAGHLVFLNTYLLLGIIYYFVLGWRRPLRPLEFILGAFLSSLIYLGGIHFVLIFILFPLGVFGAVWGVAAGIFSVFRGQWRRFQTVILRFARASSFHMVGFLVGSVKIFYVLSYQSAFPRTLESRIPEINGLPAMLYDLLMPTLGDHFLDGKPSPGPWLIWEYSLFCLLTYVLVGLILWGLFKKKKKDMKIPKEMSLLLKAWALFGFFCVALAWGDFSSWAPFTRTDQWFFSNSLRVPLRFIFPFLIGVPFVVYSLMVRVPAKYLGTMVRVLGVVAVAGLINFGGFLSLLDVGLAKTYWQTPVFPGPLQRVVGGQLAHMYGDIMNGEAVINCYTPMNRPLLFAEADERLNIDFIDDPTHEESPACLRDSYFTENDLFISPACSPNVCINLNALNFYKKTNFAFNRSRSRFCRQ